MESLIINKFMRTRIQKVTFERSSQGISTKDYIQRRSQNSYYKKSFFSHNIITNESNI